VAELSSREMQQHPEFLENVDWFCKNRPDVVRHACTTIERPDGADLLLSVVDQVQLERLLHFICDPNEFLSDAGLRSLSKYHLDHPFRFGSSAIRYEPAEEKVKIKGGNSNWRGPVWFPIAYLMLESLVAFATARERSSPGTCDLREVARTFAERLIGLFRRDAHGRRPVFGGARKFQEDPYWRDCLLFYEHFHGDNGAGLGASHQTGWTALVANLISEWRE
jgi:hypothetical protein